MVVLQTISTQKRTYYMCIFAVKVHVVRELASMIRFGIAGSDQQSQSPPLDFLHQHLSDRLTDH